MDLIPYLGSQRRRLIPALSLDTPSPVRKPTNSAGVRWVDGPLRSTQRGLGEPFEIKVYEIDDVERLQRRRLPPREGPAEVGAAGVWLGGQGGFLV